MLPEGFSLKSGEDSRFALEFLRRGTGGEPGESLGKYYFTNGPTSYSEQYRYHVSVTSTFGGVQVVDFGNAPGLLRLRGEFHIYYKGRPPKDAGKSSDSVLDQAKEFGAEKFDNLLADAFPVAGRNVRSGRMEYSDFIGLLYGIRRKSDRYQSPDEQGAEITAKFKEEPFDYSKYVLIYHDYARSRSVEIVPADEGVTVERSVEDTNTYLYNASFVIVDDRSPATRQMETFLDKALAINPFYSLSRSVTFLKTILRLPLKVSGALVTVSKFTAQFLDTGNRVIAAWDGMVDQFDSDGKLARRNFQNARENLQRTGSRGPEEDRRDDLERLIANLPGTPPPAANGRQAEFRTALNDFSRATDATMAAATGALLGPPVAVGEWSQTPEADFTPLISNPIYEPLILAQQTIVDIQADLIRAEADSSFGVTIPTAGETYEQVAERSLGDASLAGPLAAYNGQSATADPAGRPLRVPNDNRSLIISRAPADPELRDLERTLLGTDIALAGDRDLASSASGDLASMAGEVTLQNNVIDSIDTAAQSLPLHPWWGNPVSPGEVLEPFERRDAINQLLDSIRADPRVRTAALVAADQDANRITFTIRVQSVFGFASWYLQV
ncbi:MAG: hypothetical protein RIF32_20730 [Leptospirales bacterium]|jgi:hypothetical protein